MYRHTAVVALLGLLAVPLGARAQGRYGGPGQAIPPGHLPPPGACRVWYDGVPPGRQPPPTDCRTAERIASRNRDARVIYGSNTGPRYDDQWGRDRSPYPYPDRNRGGYAYNSPAYRNGYDDGYDKGRDDGHDRDRYDPEQYSRYRSADHGYERSYGSREWYRNVYRDGFRAGYEAGYRDGRDRRGWWPF